MFSYRYTSNECTRLLASIIPSVVLVVFMFSIFYLFPATYARLRIIQPRSYHMSLCLSFPAAAVDVKVGGKFSLFGGNLEGEFVQVDAPNSYTQKWRFKSWPDNWFSTVRIKQRRQYTSEASIDRRIFVIFAIMYIYNCFIYICMYVYVIPSEHFRTIQILRNTACACICMYMLIHSHPPQVKMTFEAESESVVKLTIEHTNIPEKDKYGNHSEPQRVEAGWRQKFVLAIQKFVGYVKVDL